MNRRLGALYQKSVCSACNHPAEQGTNWAGAANCPHCIPIAGPSIAIVERRKTARSYEVERARKICCIFHYIHGPQEKRLPVETRKPLVSVQYGCGGQI